MLVESIKKLIFDEVCKFIELYGKQYLHQTERL
jgi:hypothetical protein